MSYVVDLGTLATLHSALGLPLAVATTLAFATGLATNFGLNRVFAFRSRSMVGPALAKYLLLVGLNYLTTLGMVMGLAAVGLSYAVAKTLATIVNAVLNYLAYRWWVFRS